MIGNGLKRRFLLIDVFLGQFLVENIGVKNWQNVRLTIYKNGKKMPIFAQIFFD